VKTELKPCLCDSVKSNFNEFIFVECKVDNEEPLLLGLVYRSPSSTVDNCNALNELLREATKVNPKRTVILGDFNYSEILWDQEKSSAGQDHPVTRSLAHAETLSWFSSRANQPEVE
jgi:hypothetical protein